MEWISYLVAVLLVLFGGVCVLGVVVQLPGTWVLLGAAVLIELLDGLYLSGEDTTTFGTTVLVIALLLALFGEFLEFIAGVIGLRRGGGTSRGMWGAIIGGLVGLFVATPLFAFVPFFGSFLGVLLGTFVGAFIGEMTHPRGEARSALKPALWAAIGRVLGTTGKVAVAVVLWLVLAVSAFSL
jgi:uncharacterized protein YqgC (DUF456 family)